MAGRKILFVTGNAKKLQELSAIIGEQFSDLIIQRSIDLPEFQGEFEFIIKEKCKIAFEKVRSAVLVEDTSLEFEALGGLPGPYVRWFLQKIGHDGLFKMLHSWSNKTAFARCTFGFTDDGSHVEIFSGIKKGTIVSPRGTTLFGWDPIFQPENSSLTYAEMGIEEKNKISHRFMAANKLKNWLEHNYYNINK